MSFHFGKCYTEIPAKNWIRADRLLHYFTECISDVALDGKIDRILGTCNRPQIPTKIKSTVGPPFGVVWEAFRFESEQSG